MKVLALNKRCWFHPRSGGSEDNLRETLTRLSDRGHSVELVTAGYPDCDAPTEVDGVSIRRVGTDFELSAPLDTFVAHLFVTLYVHLRLLRSDPDVLYYSQSPLPWLVATDVPRVAVFHHIGVESVFETHPFPQNWIGYALHRLGMWRERDEVTVSVSPSTSAVLRSHGHDSENVREVLNGVETEQYEPGEERDDPSVLFLGGLEKYKGADRIPEIHRGIEAAFGGPVRLDVAGRPGDEADDVREYCEGRASAQFHGFVSEERKVELLQRSWVFLAPSRVEGWGMAVVEANACETPAVGMDVEGLRDSIRDGETGLLAPADDVDAFVDRTVELLADEETRRRLGRRAVEWADTHSWEASAEALESALRDARRTAHVADGASAD